MKSSFYIVILFILSSCAIQHNAPTSSNPNKQVPPNTTIVFVDQNGAFYPNDWSKVYGLPPRNGKKNAYSLSKIASEKGKEQDLLKFERSFLSTLQKDLRTDKRLFVLIHGFNANAKEVSKTYDLITNKLNVSNKDEVIEFYWDGLYTKNPFSGMKTWFSAADNSQYAGKYALRKILNSVSNKDIFLISHSRGASVVLSALSSAPLDSTKMAELAEHHGIDTVQSEKLIRNRGNRITAIALAPAIGKSDFEIKNEEDSVIQMIRFTPQLKSFHITTNSNDLMLKKVIGLLSNKLNPTDLGYKGDSFDELSRDYPMLKRTDFTGQKSHDFTKYITNPQFLEILKRYKIGK